MSKTNAWAYTDNNGKTWGFDNSPGSGFADNGPFAGINWSTAEIQITGSSEPTIEYGTIPPGELYKATVVKNGHTYVGEIFSNENGRSVWSGIRLDIYIERITYSIDGQKTFEIIFQYPPKPTYMPESTYNNNSGDVLIRLIYSQSDHMWGTASDDVIYSYGGGDYIAGLNGNDILDGGDGKDTIDGDAGNDVLVGGRGTDSLNGGSGNDVLIGGVGINVSEGWVNDFYNGGTGFDVMQTNFIRYDLFITRYPSTGMVHMYGESGYKLATISPDVEQLKGYDYTLSTDDLLYLGDVTDVPYSAQMPVYRFYNNRDKAFFYTSSKDEKDYVLYNSHFDRPDADEWPYVYQGSTFEAAHSYLGSSTLVPVFRFYNYETGHHFFTVSEAESEMIKGKIASGEWPFNYEGTRFSMYSSDPTPNFVGQELAIHRFYSPSLNRHFFTGDTEEATNMQFTGIWNYEGVAFYGEILG